MRLFEQAADIRFTQQEDHLVTEETFRDTEEDGEEGTDGIEGPEHHREEAASVSEGILSLEQYEGEDREDGQCLHQ